MTKTAAPLDIDECMRVRELLHDGHSIPEVSEELNRGYQAVKYHALGRCDHSISIPSLTRDEIQLQQNISWVDCRKLRKEAHKTDTIKELAQQYDWSYYTISTHVVGDCSHNDVGDPIPKRDRSSTISDHLCVRLREEYFTGRKSVNEIVANRKISKGAAWSHITFLCSHYLSSEVAQKHRGNSGPPVHEETKPVHPFITDMYSDEVRNRFIETYEQCLISDIEDSALLRVVPILADDAPPDDDLEPSAGLLLNGLLTDAYRAGYFTIDGDGRLWVDPDAEFADNDLSMTLKSKSGIQVLDLEALSVDTELLEDHSESLDWWPPSRKN